MGNGNTQLLLSADWLSARSPFNPVSCAIWTPGLISSWQSYFCCFGLCVSSHLERLAPGLQLSLQHPLHTLLSIWSTHFLHWALFLVLTSSPLKTQSPVLGSGTWLGWGGWRWRGVPKMGGHKYKSHQSLREKYSDSCEKHSITLEMFCKY